MRSVLALAPLVVARVALADEAAPDDYVTDPRATPGAPLPTEPAAPTAPSPADLRKGLHVGGGVGSVYLPVNDARAVVARADFVISDGRHDLRLSPVFYYATQTNESSQGLGLAIERGWNFGSRYTASIGAMVGVHHAESSHSYTTLGVALVGSPLTFRLGARENFSLGLDLMLMREFEHDTVNPGAFVAFSYLSL